VWYRILITALTLAVILYFKKGHLMLSFKHSLTLFIVGAIVAFHWVCFYGSIKYSNVSVALTCFSATGFFTALLEPLIKRKKIDLIEVFCGLVAIAGIYLIFDFYPQFKTGILFGIISALLASIFPVFNKDLVKKFSSEIVTLYEMVGGFLALTIILPLYIKVFPVKYYLPSLTDWIWLLVLAWICTVLSFILQLNALKKISAFTSNLTYNLEPVYGIILAFLIFNENKFLTAGFYYGLALIILAVVLEMGHETYKLRKRRANL
jgi:drug/metabolite transporter (DMT)-like permease